jgi:hypothetical protein
VTGSIGINENIIRIRAHLILATMEVAITFLSLVCILDAKEWLSIANIALIHLITGIKNPAKSYEEHWTVDQSTTH